jgi:hypothetical protein
MKRKPYRLKKYLLVNHGIETFFYIQIQSVKKKEKNKEF